MDSVTSMLRSAWGTYKAHWKLFTGIVAAPSALTLFGQFLLQTHSILLKILGGILMLAGSLGFFIAQIAIVTTIQKIDRNEAVLGIKQQFKEALPFFWPIVFAGILQALTLFGATSLFMIPGIIIGLYCTFYMFTVIVGGKRGFEALTESYSIVYGRWWTVFGKVITPAVVAIVLSFIVVGARFAIGGLLGIHAGTIASVNLQQVLSTIFNIVIIPVFMVYLYRLYMSMNGTRSQTAPAATFKKWLVGFLVLGIIVTVCFGGSLFFAGMNATKYQGGALFMNGEYRTRLEQGNPMTPEEIQKMIQSRIPSTPTY